LAHVYQRMGDALAPLKN